MKEKERVRERERDEEGSERVRKERVTLNKKSFKTDQHSIQVFADLKFVGSDFFKLN